MNLAALRKSAIFLASIDEATAEAVLDQLPPSEAAALRAEWALLDDVDPHQQQSVVEDFFDAGRAEPEIPDVGLALDDTLHQHLSLETPTDTVEISWAPAESREPFDFLHETDETLVAQHLAGEHPQTIALVLSHLPLPRAGAVLERLPSDVQEEALARLIEADETHPDIVREVERGLETRLTEQTRRRDQRRRGEHLATAMLAGMGSGGHLLARMSRRDPALAARLGFEPRTPRSLDELHDGQLIRALHEVGPEIAALALAGTTSQEAERVLARLPRPEAEALRARFHKLEPTRLDDFDAAYARVLTSAGSG